MTEKTVTVGDTEVLIRETEDGFEAVEAPTGPAADFVRHAEEHPCVTKLDDDTDFGGTVRLCYDAQLEYSVSASRLDVPEEATIERMERNKGYNTRHDGGVYMKLRFDEE